jgi:hypothetical protein
MNKFDKFDKFALCAFGLSPLERVKLLQRICNPLAKVYLPKK